MIYFVQDDAAFLIKIGFTDGADAERRVNTLRTGSAAGLTVLGTVPGDRVVEASIHAELAPYRAHGEWFRPHPAVVMLVMGLVGEPDRARVVAERDEIIGMLMHHVKALIGMLKKCGGGQKLTRQKLVAWMNEAGIGSSLPDEFKGAEVY